MAEHKNRFTSNQAIKLAGLLGNKWRINRDIVIAYILNQFLYQDYTHLSNQHLVYHFSTDIKTVKKVIKLMVDDGFVTRETKKVFHETGIITSHRVLKVNLNQVLEYISLCEEKSPLSPGSVTYERIANEQEMDEAPLEG